MNTTISRMLAVSYVKSLVIGGFSGLAGLLLARLTGNGHTFARLVTFTILVGIVALGAEIFHRRSVHRAAIDHAVARQRAECGDVSPRIENEIRESFGLRGEILCHSDVFGAYVAVCAAICAVSTILVSGVAYPMIPLVSGGTSLLLIPMIISHVGYVKRIESALDQEGWVFLRFWQKPQDFERFVR